MRRLLLPALVGITIFAGTLSIGLSTTDNAEFRLAGVQLLDQADAFRESLKEEGSKQLTSSDLPLPILLTAYSSTLSEETAPPFSAAAKGGAFVIALSALILTIVGWQFGGASCGLFTGLIFLLLPGTLFHARTLGPEATSLFAYTLLVAAGVQKRPLVRAVGGTFALLVCLASSHFAIVMVVPWLLAASLIEKRTPDNTSAQPGQVRLPPVPPSTFVPVLLGPLLLFELWPYLDTEGLKRWIDLAYAPFRRHHEAYVVMNDIRDQDLSRAPNFGQGLLVTLLRIPLAVGALATLGAVVSARVRSQSRPTRRGLFAVLLFLTFTLIYGLNGSPYYNGSDGFANMIPCLAVLAGLGANALWRSTTKRYPVQQRAWLPRSTAATLLLFFVLGSLPVDLARVQPHETSYYNAIIGGTTGATASGMESQVEISLPKDVVDWMNQRLPQRARLAFNPHTDSYRSLFESLKKRNVIRQDLLSAAPYDASYLFVPRHPAAPTFSDVQHHWTNPDYVYSHEGVARMSVFRY